MLTEKTIRMVTDFNYEYPNLHQHKFKDYDNYDLWFEENYFVHNKKRDLLTKEEKEKIEILLSKKQNPKDFEVVSNFVQFVLRHPIEGWDTKDNLIHYLSEQYYFYGNTKDKINKRDITEDEHLYKWITSTKGRISFFEDHYKIEKFDKLYPLYVQSLKDLIETKRG